METITFVEQKNLPEVNITSLSGLQSGITSQTFDIIDGIKETKELRAILDDINKRIDIVEKKQKTRFIKNDKPKDNKTKPQKPKEVIKAECEFCKVMVQRSNKKIHEMSARHKYNEEVSKLTQRLKDETKNLG